MRAQRRKGGRRYAPAAGRASVNGSWVDSPVMIPGTTCSQSAQIAILLIIAVQQGGGLTLAPVAATRSFPCTVT